ncbi:MAG: hypothetical protein JSV81_21365 [Anaerolineales bacterium]|nr:MAG: hypothetical protein JSV81_21365 [Anaerolineales bacterium]
MRNSLIILLSLSLLMLPAIACTITLPSVKTQVGKLREESVQVPLEDAADAEVDITFGAGELRLRPGVAEGLLEADFTYNVDELQPVLEQDRHGDRLEVTLHIETEGLSLNLGDKTRNEWDVRLSDRVPISLGLDLGAARGRVNLGGLRLTDAHIRTGAADVEVEWDQPNPELLDLLEIDAGAANLEIHQLGNAHFDQLNFTGGAGNFSLDFSGDWQQSARVSINAGLSNLTLILPEDVGVKVNTDDKALTNVNAAGFQRRASAWVNDAYGESDLELIINVDIGLGNLILIEE